MFAVVLAFGCPSALLFAIAAGESTMEGVLSPFERVLSWSPWHRMVGQGRCVADERRGGSSSRARLAPDFFRATWFDRQCSAAPNQPSTQLSF